MALRGLSLGRRREGANVKGIILIFIKVKHLDKSLNMCYNICRIRERKGEAEDEGQGSTGGQDSGFGGLTRTRQ